MPLSIPVCVYAGPVEHVPDADQVHGHLDTGELVSGRRVRHRQPRWLRHLIHHRRRGSQYDPILFQLKCILSYLVIFIMTGNFLVNLVCFILSISLHIVS